MLGDDDLALSPRLPADSVLVQTVSRARCPVVVARGDRPPPDRCSTAVDGSPSSLLALRIAAAEARPPAHPRWRSRTWCGHDDERDAGRRLLESALATVGGPRGRPAPVSRGRSCAGSLRASRRARMMIVGPRGVSGGSLLGEVARSSCCAGVPVRRCFVHGTPCRGRSPVGVRCHRTRGALWYELTEPEGGDDVGEPTASSVDTWSAIGAEAASSVLCRRARPPPSTPRLNLDGRGSTL